MVNVVSLQTLLKSPERSGLLPLSNLPIYYINMPLSPRAPRKGCLDG